MGIVTETDKRRIVPRWRGFKLAAATGEMTIVGGKPEPLPFHSKIFIEEQIQSWSKNKDLSHAGDLLSSAYVLGLEKEFIDVAQFILDSDIEENSALVKVAQKTLGINQKSLENESTHEIGGFINALDHVKFYGEIRKYKSYLNHEPKNPLAWIELGRLYSMVGLNSKAEKCILSALYLDRDNRFIVRSASRFFHHKYPNDDKALQVIKRSAFLKDDPWLLSAEIAYSTILERHSKFIKLGMDFVKKYNRDYFSITELTSALGTVELIHGKMKDAIKYFATSLIKPNDNSVAQASWISKDINGIKIDLDNYNLPLAFEAHAQLAYNERKYHEAYDYAMKWLADEPFSSRPIKFASHIACVFLDNIKMGRDLLKAGLNVNPDDPHLNNNYIYYLAKDNKLDEAIFLFESKLRQHIGGDVEVNPYTVIATAGLLAFRAGKPEEGRVLYSKAIELIKKRSNMDYLLALANLNLIEEELRYTNNMEEVITFSRQIDILTLKNQDNDDVQVFGKRLKEEISNRLRGLKRKS